jgi:hypothetical protein
VDLASHNIRWYRLTLKLSRYFFINNMGQPGNISVQLTGNTCYFQTYL